MFKELLSFIRALELYYHTAHVSVKNTVFYSDHELLGRLYDSVGSHLDALMEKSVGITGSTQEIHLPSTLQLVFNKISKLPYDAKENSIYFTAALSLEQGLLAYIMKTESTQSVGVRNLLGDIADSSENRVYLLKQRTTKNETSFIIPAPIIKQ